MSIEIEIDLPIEIMNGRTNDKPFDKIWHSSENALRIIEYLKSRGYEPKWRMGTQSDDGYTMVDGFKLKIPTMTRYGCLVAFITGRYQIITVSKKVKK